MMDFNRVLTICEDVNRISTLALDEFLMYYAANREGMEKEMDQRLARFRKVTKQFQKSWLNLIKAQYIIHRIFKEGGLIKKYLGHAAVKALPEEQQLFLHQQSAVPWRYSYSRIISSPHKDFYEMEDEFCAETFLLYSPSITKTLADQSVILWFNLIAFNGSCWQSFGPIIPFQSLDADDIFFFATELNPEIKTSEDILKDLEENPIPYLMLMSASYYPLTIQDEQEILHVVAEYDQEDFDLNLLKINFKLEYAQNVFRITNEVLNEPPHFAAAYFNETENTLLLTSLTERGFLGMVEKLNECGLDLSDEPDIRLHLSMTIAIREILGKEIDFNPYEHLFKRGPSPTEDVLMAKLNKLLSLALPYIHSGEEPDVKALAKEAGVEEEMAMDLLAKSMERMNILKSKTDKKRKE